MTGKPRVAFSNLSGLSREHNSYRYKDCYKAVIVTAVSLIGADKRGSAFKRIAVCLGSFEGEAIAQCSGNEMRFRIRVLIPLLPGCMMQF